MRTHSLSSFVLAACATLAFALPACSSSTKEGLPAAPDSGASSGPVSSEQPGPSGTDCNDITQTYSVCANVSLCPGVTIDPYTFDGCGYSIHGDAIDPECLCYGSMCPMGAPATCDDMAAILKATSVAAVCAQFASGHCTNLGSAGQPSTCQQCKQNCDGNVTCLQRCGC